MPDPADPSSAPPAPTPDAAPWLVLGASAGIGRALLSRLQDRRQPVVAVSRRAAPAWAGAQGAVDWLRADLGDPAWPVRCPTAPPVVVSAGPLALFAAGLDAAAWPVGTRVIAVSSMSAVTKPHAPSRLERAVARALLEGEARVMERAAALGWRATVLRPTLLWGGSSAHSLGRLVRVGQALGVLPLPRSARGLRQPVHVDDIARAVVAAAARADLAGARLRLGGGERLDYREMARRVMRAAGVEARVLAIPDALCWPLLALLAACGARGERLASQVRRSRDDLVAPMDDWMRLDLWPRAFEPAARSD